MFVTKLKQDMVEKLCVRSSRGWGKGVGRGGGEEGMVGTDWALRGVALGAEVVVGVPGVGDETEKGGGGGGGLLREESRGMGEECRLWTDQSKQEERDVWGMLMKTSKAVG